MHMALPRMLAACIAVLTTTLLSAQVPGPGGPAPTGPPPMGPPSPMMLIGQKVVQDELKLSADQRKKVGDLRTRAMRAMQRLRGQPPDKIGEKMQEITRESEKELAGIFNADQARRFKEIALQQQGIQALAQPDVAKEVGLSDEQQKKVKDACESGQKERAKLFQGRPGTPEMMRKAMEKITKATSDQIFEILTTEQKTQWEKMKGKSVKGLQAMPAFPAPPPPR